MILALEVSFKRPKAKKKITHIEVSNTETPN